MKKHDQKGTFSDRESAERFARLSERVFAPVNTAIARQIVAECGITRGTAIEIGSGPAHLAIEVARITDLRVIALDISVPMRSIAARTIHDAGLYDQITPLSGDAAAIPLSDASTDLVFSKGSAFFWPDPAGAFREIRRVLGPGGQAWIGGGFGSAEILERVREQMDRIDTAWIEGVHERLSDRTAERFRADLDRAGIEDYTILREPWHLWIRFSRGEG
ncbi:class I SAM-dependent methyltransferase [Methanofollis fontis]|uniref:class I SAM-dependent methyltransferase n=1 Tax=Methanofollis fontis TaxID=2052832 RepID=UPI0013EE96C3|nr:class I SAM-dependent methyltransferase [Methanofollis fontis]